MVSSDDETRGTMSVFSMVDFRALDKSTVVANINCSLADVGMRKLQDSHFTVSKIRVDVADGV